MSSAMCRGALAVLAASVLAACGGPPLQTFPPLDYSYLPPITLRVATINVVNNYVPDPGAANLIGQDPAPPGDTLQTVLNHRLLASGAPGSATATIETASIDQIGGNLTGTLAVQLNVTSPDGLHTGFTQATVTQSDPAPDPTSSQNLVQAALYQMTKELMQQMNVQLQYQIQHNLGNWVVLGNGIGPAPDVGPGSIQAAPLAPPGPAASLPATVPGQTLPGGISPSAIPPAPPASLAPQGSSPIPLTPPAAPPPPAPAAPATPPPFNPANVGL